MNFFKKKPYLIAEIGVNHNGKLSLAIQTIKAAAKAGADAVKFQMFNADEFMSKKKLLFKYKTKKGNKSENMYDMFKRLEFSEKWLSKIIQVCKRNKVDFLSSVADKSSANLMKKLKVKAIKLSSEDLINYPLLEHVATLGRNIILSTGMANSEEITRALSFFKKKKIKVIILHCVSMYPTSIKDANLLRMVSLKKKYNVSVGYSDHTLGIEASIVATILGAEIIEKHFTLNKSLIGPDHVMSSDPKEFKELADNIKRIHLILGSSDIKPKKTEQKFKKIYRRSITSISQIAKGEKFSLKNIALMRPATGLHPKYYKKIIGKKTSRRLLKDKKIQLKDIKN
ncbi:N-acetylneuraminate synthase family protein [Candidatus Pelagibacter ubique]|nr:N-acetylneuraminate synthase family protein [Candidatus Pelagibacter ubique]